MGTGVLTEKYAGVVAVPAACDIEGAEQLQHRVVHNGAQFLEQLELCGVIQARVRTQAALPTGGSAGGHMP